MLVKFITSISTPSISYGAGSTADLPEILAHQWAAAGYCVLVAPVVEEAPPPAPALAPAPEPDKPRPPRRRVVKPPVTELSGEDLL